jgi:hypothetical protein
MGPHAHVLGPHALEAGLSSESLPASVNADVKKSGARLEGMRRFCRIRKPMS